MSDINKRQSWFWSVGLCYSNASNNTSVAYWVCLHVSFSFAYRKPLCGGGIGQLNFMRQKPCPSRGKVTVTEMTRDELEERYGVYQIVDIQWDYPGLWHTVEKLILAFTSSWVIHLTRFVVEFVLFTLAIFAAILAKIFAAISSAILRRFQIVRVNYWLFCGDLNRQSFTRAINKPFRENGTCCVIRITANRASWMEMFVVPSASCSISNIFK